MKNLFILFLAVLLLAACKTTTIVSGATEEPLYIDTSNNLTVVKRGFDYYYLVYEISTKSYILKEVPFANTYSVKPLKHAKHIHYE